MEKLFGLPFALIFSWAAVMNGWLFVTDGLGFGHVVTGVICGAIAVALWRVILGGSGRGGTVEPSPSYSRVWDEYGTCRRCRGHTTSGGRTCQLCNGVGHLPAF